MMNNDENQSLTCKWCGNTFERQHQRGRPPDYCSKTHREAAYRRRVQDRADTSAGLLAQLSKVQAVFSEQVAEKLKSVSAIGGSQAFKDVFGKQADFSKIAEHLSSASLGQMAGVQAVFSEQVAEKLKSVSAVGGSQAFKDVFGKQADFSKITEHLNTGALGTGPAFKKILGQQAIFIGQIAEQLKLASAAGLGWDVSQAKIADYIDEDLIARLRSLDGITEESTFDDVLDQFTAGSSRSDQLTDEEAVEQALVGTAITEAMVVSAIVLVVAYRAMISAVLLDLTLNLYSLGNLSRQLTAQNELLANVCFGLEILGWYNAIAPWARSRYSTEDP